MRFYYEYVTTATKNHVMKIIKLNGNLNGNDPSNHSFEIYLNITNIRYIFKSERSNAKGATEIDIGRQGIMVTQTIEEVLSLVNTEDKRASQTND